MQVLMKARSMGMTTLLLLSMLGCHKVTVVDTPPGVVPQEVAAWYQATGAVKIWSEASLNLTKAAIDLHATKVYPSEDAYQSTLEALGKENQLGLQATAYLATVPDKFDATAQNKIGGILDQGLATFDDATQVGLLQIKNPDKKQAIDSGITALRSSLKLIFALVHPGTQPPAKLK